MSALDRPTRGDVFAEILWRAMVLSIFGGVLVASGVFFVLAQIHDDFPRIDFGLGEPAVGGYGFASAIWVACVGACFGFLLGGAAGVMLGGVGAIVLVPYKGRLWTIWTVRLVAMIVVAGFLLLVLQIDRGSRAVVPLFVCGVIGAAVASPWLVGWYIDRMEPQPS